MESSDCRSWSTSSCTTKIQSNVCWMVGQIQNNCRHPCSMSRAIPCSSSSCSWTWRIISKIRIPIVRLLRMKISFFTWRFWGRKSWLRIWTFFSSSTLIFTRSFVWLELPVWTFILKKKYKNRCQEICSFLSKGLFCLSFLWTTKHSLLLTTNHCLVFVLHQGMRYQFFWIHLGLYLYLYVFFFSLHDPLNGLDCQTYPLSSHVQEHDLSSSKKPCSPADSSMAHRAFSSSG